VLACPECKTVHHRECWREVGGCSTYGCGRAPAAKKESAPAQPSAGGWGDYKQCPFCRQAIPSGDWRCRWCGAAFDTLDPITPEEAWAKMRMYRELAGLQTTAAVLFGLSLVGFLAPIILIVALLKVPSNRDKLSRGGPFYLFLGYSAIALSLLYCVVFALVMLLS
jgi:hypothetical protein